MDTLTEYRLARQAEQALRQPKQTDPQLLELQKAVRERLLAGVAAGRKDSEDHAE